VPNWSEVSREINDWFGVNPLDNVRKKYLKKFYKNLIKTLLVTIRRLFRDLVKRFCSEV